MNEENEASKELCLNDPNASGDSRALGSLENFDNVQFKKRTSSGDRILEDLDPSETVEKIGSDMKELFTYWSERFSPSKQIEEETLRSMDSLKKQAYMLEAEFLECKLDLIKRHISTD